MESRFNMIEYPSIINSSKAPRKECIAFYKYDGSNFRAKWTKKNGFCLFGSRTQLIDESHPHLGASISIFQKEFAGELNKHFQRHYMNEREIVVYGEFFGKLSFAGIHEAQDPKEIVLFDVLVGNKNRKFVLPRQFIKEFAPLVKTAKVVYEGNLNEEFIQSVRNNEFDLDEGVICKGIEPSGAFRGGVWQCKIKTLSYFEKLKKRFNNDWEKYAE